TCTDIDRKAGAALAEIAGIDAEKFAHEMFRAGSNLGSKTPEEIIHQDFKRFSVNELTIGIGQINSMDAEELKEIEKKVEAELENERSGGNLDMIFMLFTDIISESSEVFFTGKDSAETISNAFNLDKTTEGSVILPGVVSRKKQFLPAIVEALQQ
ncbi:MAG: inorganic diphosphatase, partial [Clostridium sp.]|nr:inorganic diphosphatase [Clostridium sp.]